MIELIERSGFIKIEYDGVDWMDVIPADSELITSRGELLSFIGVDDGSIVVSGGMHDYQELCSYGEGISSKKGDPVFYFPNECGDTYNAEHFDLYYYPGSIDMELRSLLENTKNLVKFEKERDRIDERIVYCKKQLKKHYEK